MPDFLVELYVPKADRAPVAVWAERLRGAAAELTVDGKPVRLLRSILVPEDETCFLLVEAESVATVREAATRAALAFERVAEATVDLVTTPGREQS